MMIAQFTTRAAGGSKMPPSAAPSKSGKTHKEANNASCYIVKRLDFRKTKNEELYQFREAHNELAEKALNVNKDKLAF